MSLQAVTDGYLAARVVKGDGVAFAELARRYRPLIGRATRWAPQGVEPEDLRQEALLGLLATCFAFDRAKGPFPVLARMKVRERVNRARHAAYANKHRVLSEAFRDGDEPMHQLAERTPAPEATGPARLVELREALREHAERARQPRPDRRRRYSDEQRARALALIADGRTIKQTAFVVGVPSTTVQQWVKRAGQAHAGRRRFTPSEVSTAVALVHGGASLRQAGAAVGASSPAVLRWVRQAA
jgi:transposase-like protein